MNNIADRIRTAQDKDGMLRRALERIIQLYTDKSHFIYELLQNAEDAEATSVRFEQYPDRLEVLHNGKPFSEQNLQGLCDIGKSDKVDQLNQIGEFGVGFKSVFGICDTVKLYSEPSHFRNPVDYECDSFAVEIRDFTRPIDIKNESMVENYTTRFVFPYVVGKSFSGFSSVDQLRITISKKLQNLGVTTLLFMKKLESIEYHIYTQDNPIDGEYLLEKETINDHCMLVSALGTNALNKNDTEITSYLRFSRPIAQGSPRTVDIAFPVIKKEDGAYECKKSDNPYVSVYFPTETESKLNFIIQGPFRTTPNRSSIPADDQENTQLARTAALLLKNTLIELRNSGILNMSFVKVLPLNERAFDNFALFKPMYEVVKNLFLSSSIIPTRDDKYVSANKARLARQEKLSVLFPDAELTRLINDGNEYKWLPTYLTETNRDYDGVYRYLSSELHIPVVRPEDLRTYFAANPKYLPTCSKDWLVELYSMLENVGAAFSKSRYESNMLTAEIVRTSSGKFVAAYRKTDKAYIPNVFVPTPSIKSNEIYFVDSELYERCRHFFDDILQLSKPNEYELVINDIRKRYKSGVTVADEQHIDDINHLVKYLKNDDYHDEVKQLIKDVFSIRCTDGRMRNTFAARVYLPITDDGVNIEGYYRNIVTSVFFADAEFYSSHDIEPSVLEKMGVRSSLLTGDGVTNGIYETGNKGRQPEWSTVGNFRWKLSIDAIDRALKYISDHSTTKDAILKSQTIFKLLLQNETRLCGTVYIGGSTPNLCNETCDLIKYLRGERRFLWDGKWLFTESGELVSPKMVSKHDICQAFYGQVNPTSTIYELLGFKKSEEDEIDELKKQVSQKQLDALFEDELRRRFGITSHDLEGRFPHNSGDSENAEEHFEFPVARIKNWEALRKHAAEMMVYAAPVKYEYKIRLLRVSNHPKETKAYLHNMYRYVGTYKYACQMCHDVCSSIASIELFLKPEAELDPIHLCLCNNCANVYAQLRNKADLMSEFRKRIIGFKESDVMNGEQVVVPLGDCEIWFTQTHFAEIQELLKLEDEIKMSDQKGEITAIAESKTTPDNETENSGLSVYSSYVGKAISRKDGFKGIVTKVDSQYLYVDTTDALGRKKETKIQLEFYLSHKGIYLLE